MPNIGFWATAGAGGASGAMELIATAYGNGSSQSITLSSIPSTYKHLQLRVSGLITSSGYRTQVRLNGDTSGSYTSKFLNATGSGVYMEQGGVGYGQTKIDITSTACLQNTYPDVAIIDIFDYLNTSKVKTIKSMSGAFTYGGGSAYVSLATGSLLSTSAINSVTLFANTGTWSSSARVSLYGVVG